MNRTDVPVVSHVFESGPDDRMFDSLLLAGPLTIALVAVLGRSWPTVLTASAYISLFVAYVLYQGIQG